MTMRGAPACVAGGALVGLMAVVVACGGGPGPAVDDTPVDGDMLVVGIAADFDTLFLPMTNMTQVMRAGRLLYWPLLRPEADGERFRLGLADSFRYAPDSLAIDFFLHPGLTWHDGVPVTADDVVLSHRVCTAPEVAFAFADDLSHIVDVEPLDDATVRFRFDRAYTDQVLDATLCVPLPHHILGDVPLDELRNHQIHRAPVGNGPFRFVSWDAQQEIVMEANPTFVHGRPHLDRIVFRIVPEAASRATQLGSGEIDLWLDATKTFVPQIRANPNLVVHTYPSGRYTFVAWNVDDPILAERPVRRALSLAVDREALAATALNGEGAPLVQPLSVANWAHDPDLETASGFDPDLARRTLEAAGWVDTDGNAIREKNGSRLAVTIHVAVENQSRVDTATIVQQMFRDVGVDAQIRTSEFGTLIDRATRGELPAVLRAYGGG
ncbi:MAG: peptide ABC transporter substrate-binding protein, partial [Gemmatimonadetes bacterium]|nr:peptide ABC transporter substrate-binding protein [Gemmatimonadota bacterium]